MVDLLIYTNIKTTFVPKQVGLGYIRSHETQQEVHRTTKILV